MSCTFYNSFKIIFLIIIIHLLCSSYDFNSTASPNVACCVVYYLYLYTKKNSTLISIYLPTKMICFWLNLLNKKIIWLFKKKFAQNCFVETCRIGTTLVWNGIRVILEVWKVLGFTHQDYGLQICWCITGTVLLQWIVLCLFWITHPTRYIVGYIIQKRFAEEFNQL